MLNQFWWECALFAVLGGVLYFLDNYFGMRWYRKIYNQLHKDPLPETVERSFLVGRTIRARITPALIISMVIAVLTLFVGTKIISPDAKLELSAGFFLRHLFTIPISLSLGFFIAALMKRGGGVEKVAGSVIDTMDRAESGDFTPIRDAVNAGTQKARDAANEVARAAVSVVDEFDPMLGKAKPKGEGGQPPAPTAPPPPPEEPTRRDFNEQLRNFRKG